MKKNRFFLVDAAPERLAILEAISGPMQTQATLIGFRGVKKQST